MNVYIYMFMYLLVDEYLHVLTYTCGHNSYIHISRTHTHTHTYKIKSIIQKVLRGRNKPIFDCNSVARINNRLSVYDMTMHRTLKRKRPTTHLLLNWRHTSTQAHKMLLSFGQVQKLQRKKVVKIRLLCHRNHHQYSFFVCERHFSGNKVSAAITKPKVQNLNFHSAMEFVFPLHEWEMVNFSFGFA